MTKANSYYAPERADTRTGRPVPDPLAPCPGPVRSIEYGRSLHDRTICLSDIEDKTEAVTRRLFLEKYLPLRIRVAGRWLVSPTARTTIFQITYLGT